MDYVTPVISYKQMTYITDFSTVTIEYDRAPLTLHKDVEGTKLL
jgi:hypothetical protein